MLLAGRCNHGTLRTHRSAASVTVKAVRSSFQHQQPQQHQHQHQHQQPANEPSTSGRRDLLALSLAAGVTIAASPAFADEYEAPQVVSPVVQEYRRTAQKLVKGMRETIELEVSGASEREVRRKAEQSNVKTLVKEFINKWQESPAVFSDPSRAEIKAAVVELGAFYQQNGSRTKLPQEVSSSILGHLSAAEELLGPVEAKKGLLSFF